MKTDHQALTRLLLPRVVKQKVIGLACLLTLSLVLLSTASLAQPNGRLDTEPHVEVTTDVEAEDTEHLVTDTEHQLTQPNWGIGTKWYYEYEMRFPNEITFKTFEITDTTTFRGEQVYVLTTPQGETYLKQSDGRVWIYIEDMDDYQLTYDFNLTDETPYQWGAICPDSIDGASTHTSHMTIDSIVNYQLPDGSTTQLQYVFYTESTASDTYGSASRVAIKDIGFDARGLGLNTGYLVCDPVLTRYTQLRCFEQDGDLLNFVGYPCDTTYMVVSTKEVAPGGFSVFPNPSSGIVQVATDQSGPISYQVYSMDGRLLHAGVAEDRSITVSTTQGPYFLRLLIDGAWVGHQVMVK